MIYLSALFQTKKKLIDENNNLKLQLDDHCEKYQKEIESYSATIEYLYQRIAYISKELEKERKEPLRVILVDRRERVGKK